MGKPQDFYDPMAGDYDRMFDFETRLAGTRALAAGLEKRLGRIGAAVDMACGTGVYGLALAERGARVVGVDVSAAMVEQARTNAERLGYALEWRVQGMQAALDTPPADVVLCMGNSLPHLLDERDLQAAMDNFAASLRPGGRVVLHLLNYTRILRLRERIVGVTRSEGGDREFVRFYDFPERATLDFNLLVIDWRDAAQGGEASTTIQTVELYPYTAGELQEALVRAGFVDVECFGGPGFVPWDEHGASTLLMLGRREWGVGSGEW